MHLPVLTCWSYDFILTVAKTLVLSDPAKSGRKLGSGYANPLSGRESIYPSTDLMKVRGPEVITLVYRKINEDDVYARIVVKFLNSFRMQ